MNRIRTAKFRLYWKKCNHCNPLVSGSRSIPSRPSCSPSHSYPPRIATPSHSYWVLRWTMDSPCQFGWQGSISAVWQERLAVCTLLGPPLIVLVIRDHQRLDDLCGDIDQQLAFRWSRSVVSVMGGEQEAELTQCLQRSSTLMISGAWLLVGCQLVVSILIYYYLLQVSQCPASGLGS